MGDVTWAKIKTNMPNNPKMKLIKALPEGDALYCIWVDLILKAAEIADNGYIYIEPEIPFTDDELATILNRPVTIIRLAIQTFERYQMLTIDDTGFLLLNSFRENQNADALTKIRLSGATRQQRWRDKQRIERETVPLIPEFVPDNVTDNVTVTLRNATDKNRIDKNIRDKNREKQREWKRVLNILKGSMNKRNYETYFKDTVLVERTASEIKIGCVNESIAKHLETNSLNQLQQTIQQVTGDTLTINLVLIER